MLKHLTKSLILLLALQFSGLSVVNAYEFERDTYVESLSTQLPSNQMHQVRPTQAEYNWQDDYTQNQRGGLKSQSQVIREVKSRYNAEVLKISLSQNSRFYNVRVLMPNGRVKTIKVNAQR